MTAPVPIRDGVEPSIDIAREMRDYVWSRIDEQVQAGVPLHSIAVVLVGDPLDGASTTSAFSWSPTSEESSRLHCCAAAAAVLLKRALGL